MAHEKASLLHHRPDPRHPRGIVTDPQRLRQILKNLLVNAFKFTEHGSVGVSVGLTDSGWINDTRSLVDAPSVVALSVTDTGIGINDEQQQRIFEAFAQGDGTTARLYGGTGLGLSISRELATSWAGRSPSRALRVRAVPSPSIYPRDFVPPVVRPRRRPVRTVSGREDARTGP